MVSKVNVSEHLVRTTVLQNFFVLQKEPQIGMSSLLVEELMEEVVEMYLL